jgi:DNA-binding protein HU-beta
MGKAELIGFVQADLGDGTTRKAAETAFDAVMEAIKATLQRDGKVSIPDFGTFKIRERAARQARNPRTGATVSVPASRTITFRPAPTVKSGL